MLPLLLAAPEGRPARLVGKSPAFLALLQNLRSVGWPCVLHDASGGGPLAGFPGLQVATDAPPAQAVRQASLVLIGADCPDAWRDAVRRDLAGAGVPFWDERDAEGSTLAFPRWVPGHRLSAAFWSGAGLPPAQADVLGAFFSGTEGLLAAFLKLAEELRPVFEGLDDKAFRDKVVSQMARPEVLTLLLKGQHDQARNTVLRIVGSTTRVLD